MEKIAILPLVVTEHFCDGPLPYTKENTVSIKYFVKTFEQLHSVIACLRDSDNECLGDRRGWDSRWEQDDKGQWKMINWDSNLPDRVVPEVARQIYFLLWAEKAGIDPYDVNIGNSFEDIMKIMGKMYHDNPHFPEFVKIAAPLAGNVDEYLKVLSCLVGKNSTELNNAIIPIIKQKIQQDNKVTLESFWKRLDKEYFPATIGAIDKVTRLFKSQN